MVRDNRSEMGMDRATINRLNRAAVMTGEYGRGGVEVLAATCDIIDDTMDIISDIIIDAGYFMNTVATGFDRGKPIENAGIALQKLLVDAVGALASIAGSVVVGGAKAGEVMARVATEASALRPAATGVGAGLVQPYHYMGGDNGPIVPHIAITVPLPVSEAMKKGTSEGIVIARELIDAVEYATNKGMLLKAV